MAKLRETLTTHGSYLTKESVLILLFSYVVLVGGQIGGLIDTDLRMVNTALLALIGLVWVTVRLFLHWPFPRTALDVPLIGYMAVHAITAATSMDPRRSAICVWLLALSILVFYLFVDLLRHGWTAELLVKVLLVVGAIVLLLGVLEITGWYKAWHDVWGWARPIPATTTRVGRSVGDPNWLAALLNLLWPLALVHLWGKRSLLVRSLPAVWLVLAVILLYFTSSRGGWLGTIAAAGTVFLLSRDLRQYVRKVWSWLTARRWRVMIGATLALAASVVGATLVVRQLAHPSHGSGLEARLYFWRPAWAAFRSSPLLGTGPFTYGETFLLARSIPPERPYSVAHSYPITLAAESGLLGLAALAWLTIALVRHVWRTWGRLSAAGRPIRVGALAALVGCAVHSQFDSVAGVPYISVILAFLLALLLAPQPSPPFRPRASRRRATLWLLPVSWGLLLVTAVWSLRATLPFSRGIEAANADRWLEAASLFDVAEQRDPAFAYYDLQAGYTHGMLAADGDRAHLDAAIAYYEDGLRRSPNYGLNAAHLGALYRQAGNADQAVTWAERALDLAPRSALFALNLGCLYEELGQPEPAEQHYKRALNRAPEWATAAFWRATPLRRAIADDWLAAHPPPAPADDPHSAREWSIVGRHALEAGRAAEALDAFARAARIDPHDVGAHVGQGRAYLALGRTAEAEQALRTALMGGVSLELDHARAVASLAQMYHQEGDLERAIPALQAAISHGQQALAQEPSVLGWRSYPNFLFYRESPEEHLLPQLAVITVTDEVAEWMLQLGAWHEEAGDQAAAREIYREVVEAVPDSETARQRLADLGN